MEKFEFYGAPDIEQEMAEAKIGGEHVAGLVLKDIHRGEKPAHMKTFNPRGQHRMKIMAKRGLVQIGKGGKISITQRGAQAAKLKPGEKMVFGKVRKVEELEAEIERLESTSSPFPEVRERRIREAKEELKKVLHQG